MDDHLDLDEPLPRLSASDVADDELLAEAVDRAIYLISFTTPYLAQLRDVVRLQQEAMRAAFPESWQAYLAIEEAENARFSELILAVVRWAFTEGARSVHRSSGGT